MRASGPECDEVWDRKIGAAWADVLRLRELDPAGRVAEVGPGFTLKVGFGLRKHGFRGTLYIVEPNHRISEWITERYRKLLPGARIVPLRAGLRAAAACLPAGLDAVLMNHLIDDLLLDAAIPGRRRAAIFGNMHPGADCSPRVRRVWRSLADHPARLARITRRVVEDICSLHGRTRPAMLAINHYQSWFHTHNDLSVVDQIAGPVLLRLAGRLNTGGAGLAHYSGSDACWLIAPPGEALPTCRTSNASVLSSCPMAKRKTATARRSTSTKCTGS